MSESHRDDGDGFVAFFGRYARTRYHTIATAAVTVFGTLTFVDRLFAVVAVASYVLPPIALYLTDPSLGRERGTAPDAGAGGGREPSPAATRASSVGSADGGAIGSAAPADAGGGDDGAADGDTGSGDSPAGSGSEPDPRSEWRRVDAPTDETLADAAVADGRAYAVGDGGSLLAGDADGWRVAVADGPGAASNALTGVAATDGGVWFAGDDGAVGRFDPESGRHVDHSAPDDDTTNLAGVAAADDGDGETLLLVDGSGRVRRGRYRDGGVTWDDPVTPGSGSSVSGATLVDGSEGYLCDTNAGVYALADRGTAFDRIGLDSADGTLTDVAALDSGSDVCLVCDDAGVVHRYDGTTWTPERLDDGPLWALAAADGSLLAAADRGAVYERAVGAADWERVATPVAATLRGVGIGDGYAVAVGDDGAVVERSAGGR